ncbi:MAG: apolipoprotein N-acyltransferase [Gemmatimonadota bacterium]|nr:apolipoprotein N-acyltransferase [Gemmatimonadota bacterium]
MKIRPFGIRPSRREALAALASAALFAISFPPFPLAVPVLFCLVPVTVLVAQIADWGGHGWEAARAGFWFGFIGYGANLYWIAVALLLYTKLALLGYVASLIWLAPVVGATMAAVYFARKLTGWPLAILLPIIWTASELALNYLSDLSFPWLPLGLALAHVPILAQIADISGVRTVSFFIAAVNGLFADAWLHRSFVHGAMLRIGAAVVLITTVASYGAWRMATIELSPIARIAIVQPDIPEEAKLTTADPTLHVAKLVAMTRAEAARSSPDLIVWPEASLDRFLWQYPNWADSLRSAVAAHPTPMIVGFMDSGNPLNVPFAYYNAALLTDPRGNVSPQPPYRKHYLVPIVERVPFLNPEWFHGVDYFGGFSRGTSEEPFSLQFGGVGVLICYESIFPQLARDYAREGTTVLLNITNDAWFQRSNAPYQHFAHLSLRAIETRLPIVRAANTGISGWIDPLGRVRAETPIFVPRTATYAVEGTSVRTLYVRVGDWIGSLCLVLTTGMMFGAWRAARFRARSKLPAEPIANG